MSALDSFAKIPLSRKIAGVIVLLAVGGVIYYFVRYQSLANDLSRLQRQNITLQNREREYIQKRDSYEADVRRLAHLREEFASQSRILPPNAEMSSFLESLNDNAELAGLEISLVQPLDEESMGFYAKIPVELHLRGQYHELAKFFYNVGRLERIINIENIVLNTSNQSSSSSNNEEEATARTDNTVILDAEVLATTFRALNEDSGGAEAVEGGG